MIEHAYLIPLIPLAAAGLMLFGAKEDAHSPAPWIGVVAMVVQLLVFWVVTHIIPTIAKGIPEGKVAQGVFLGSLSVATGVLNAACITY